MAGLGDTEQNQRVVSELDSLTGLPGLRLFMAELESELAQARRRASSLALLLVDVDDFKRVNDLVGHLQGDEVLRRLSNRLRVLARPTDVVARVGGDEFAVALPDSSLDDAEHLALRLEIALRVRPLHPPLRISVTHGAAELAYDADLEALFGRTKRELMVRLAAKRTERPEPAATRKPELPPAPSGRPSLRLLPGGGEEPDANPKR
jgi:diguanylate cyclase (GGDEF)-like protein